MEADDERGSWRCATCGYVHTGLATVFGPNAPAAWFSASRLQRLRGRLSGDVCHLKVGGLPRSFIRGHLVIGVVDRPASRFVWSVWAELSLSDMELCGRWWDSPDRAVRTPLLPGKLSSELPYDGETMGLPLNFRTREPGVVPLFELPVDGIHPLMREQTNGIDWHRVHELNRMLLGHPIR